MIQTLISDFGESQRQSREQFVNRKESLLGAIRSGEREAAKQHRLSEYRERTKIIRDTIQNIETQIDNSISGFYLKMQNCTSSDACTEIKTEFNLILRKVLDEFEDAVLEVEIINVDVNNQVGNISLKDEVMKDTTSKNTRLETLANEIWLKADDAINEYTSLGRNIDIANSSKEAR